MQLFILDTDPAKVPLLLCDSHVRKMCLETAQILSSVMVLQRKALTEAMPKAYNLHHCVIRALDTPFKVNWTVLHLESLHREYLFRFGKSHRYASLCGEYRRKLYTEKILEEDWSFARAFKDFSTDEAELIKAYRQYYCFKKTLLKNFSYTRRTEPEFLLTPVSLP